MITLEIIWTQVEKPRTSSWIIDGHKVETKALLVGLEYELEAVDAEWARRHVQQSRYSIQIIKCTDSSCCTKFQTNWMQVFPQRFIPFPAVYSYAVSGMKALDPDTVASNPKAHDMPLPLLQNILYRS